MGGQVRNWMSTGTPSKVADFYESDSDKALWWATVGPGDLLYLPTGFFYGEQSLEQGVVIGSKVSCVMKPSLDSFALHQLKAAQAELAFLDKVNTAVDDTIFTMHALAEEAKKEGVGAAVVSGGGVDAPVVLAAVATGNGSAPVEEAAAPADEGEEAAAPVEEAAAPESVQGEEEAEPDEDEEADAQKDKDKDKDKKDDDNPDE